MAQNKDASNARRKVSKFNITLVFLGLTVLGNPKPAKAQYFTGTKANSMGGAGRAAGESEGHVLNPASMVHLKNFSIDGGYRYQSLEDLGGVRDYSINVVDGSEGNLFRAGIAYVNSEKKYNGILTSEEDYILSFGGFVAEGLSLGGQVQRWSQRLPYAEEQVIYQYSMGALYIPAENFGVGLVSYNMLDDHEPQLKPEIGLGLHYLYEPVFRARFDISYPLKYNPEKKGIIMLGTETLFISGFKPRLGAKFDDVSKKTFLTAGLGWDGPKFAINYAFEKDIRTKDQIRQSFDLNLIF